MSVVGAVAVEGRGLRGGSGRAVRVDTSDGFERPPIVFRCDSMRASGRLEQEMHSE